MTTIAVHRQFLDKRRDVVKAFVKAYSESIYVFTARKDASLAVLAKRLKQQSGKILEETYDYYARSFSVPPRTDRAARRLAATVLIEPYTEKVRKLGFPIILDLGGLKEAFPTVSLATARKYLATNREVTKRFLKGISEGVYVFKTNRELALKSLAKWMKTQDPETLDLTYKSHFPKMDFPPITELSGIEAALEFLSQSRPEAKNRESKEFVNETILVKLQQEGFFRSLSKSGK